MPQVLVEHEEDEDDGEKPEKEAPPATFDAKVDNFFFTWLDPHQGHSTSSMENEERSSSSKGFPQSSQVNSKIGMIHLR